MLSLPSRVIELLRICGLPEKLVSCSLALGILSYTGPRSELFLSKILILSLGFSLFLSATLSEPWELRAAELVWLGCLLHLVVAIQ